MEQSEVDKIIILMEVKTQEQVLKLFSACVVIISIQRNEQNTGFKHQICSNMVLSMLHSLQDPEEWVVYGAISDYNLDYSLE